MSRFDVVVVNGMPIAGDVEIEVGVNKFGVNIVSYGDGEIEAYDAMVF